MTETAAGTIEHIEMHDPKMRVLVVVRDDGEEIRIGTTNTSYRVGMRIVQTRDGWQESR